MKASVCFFGLLLLTVPLAAQNLLSNPGFDSNLSGWTSDYGTLLIPTWSPVDALGKAGSGSVSARAVFDAGSGVLPSLFQCVPVTAGNEYALGVRVQIPHGQSNTGIAQIRILFFDGANCTGTFISDNNPGTVSSPSPRFTATGTPMSAPSGARSAQVQLLVLKNEPGGFLIANFDDAFFGVTTDCLPRATVLCLGNGRFSVEAFFVATSESNGPAQAVQLTSDTGYFWFFNAENVEMVVKVLNGCGINSRYWVFAGGLTNVAVLMTARDTASGEVNTYENPLGTPFQPIQDTSAFTTCP